MLSARLHSRTSLNIYSSLRHHSVTTTSPSSSNHLNENTNTDQLQYQLNSQVINNLKSLNEEVNNNESNDDENKEDVEPFTCVANGTLKRETMPNYISLTQYNDSPSLVPKLTHHLSSTLFSPGVHYLNDPRTNRCNFDKSLNYIPHIDDLKMDKISNFTPSSRDNKLLEIVTTLNKIRIKKYPYKKSLSAKFYSSTSSMTSVLVKFHKFLSNNRPINTTNFSKFYPDSTQFTKTSDVPTSLVITPKDENKQIYSIDADRSTDSEITLSILGNALELMLTKNPKEFSKYLKTSNEIPEEDKSAYHYAKIGKFVVRSQLDAVDNRLPGTGTFDIKTRAVCAIRFDLSHTDYFPTNYEINRTFGLFESFERELFDAARIVMFKYSLQARLGNMDGIFMAFHNIKKFLGFQYLPLSEIDNIFFGDFSVNGKKYGQKILGKKVNNEDDENEINTLNQLILKQIVNDFGNHHQTKREVLSSFIADYELKISMSLLENLLETIIKDTKGKPFRMIVKKTKLSFNHDDETKREDEKEKVKDIEKDEKDIEEDEKDIEKATREKEKDVEKKVEKDDENKKENIKYNENKIDNSEKNVTKEDDKKNDNENNSDSIVVVVNTLEEDELHELQMLSREKIEQSKILIKNAQNEKEISASDRIKYFSKYVSEFRNKFFKLNRLIYRNSKNDGFFAYQLKAEHYFNGIKNEHKYPMPSVEILDNNKEYLWDVKYSINKLNRESDKKYLYDKFIKNIAFTSFRDNDNEGNVDVYTDEGDIQLDSNATALQNITRAYSAKALKRKEFFNSNKKISK